MERIEVEHQGDVVIARFPENPTAESMHAFFDAVEPVLRRRPLSVVVDALEVKSASFSMREAAASRLKAIESLLEKNLRGQATVLSSPLVRGALTAVHFLSPPKYPTKAFRDLDEAVGWAKAQNRISLLTP